MKLAAVLGVSCLLTFPNVVEASTVVLGFDDGAAITDIGTDGIGDYRVHAVKAYGTNKFLDFDAARLSYDNIPLCGTFGCSQTHNRAAFFEFDLSGVDLNQSKIVLKFTRFNATAQFPNGTAFSSGGKIRVQGYVGNGIVKLGDYTAATEELALTEKLPNGALSQTYEFDVTEYARSLGGAHLGIRFDMAGRSGAYLWDDSHLYQGEIDWSTFVGPKLEVTSLAAVPLPASAGLVLSAFAMMALAGRRKRRRG